MDSRSEDRREGGATRGSASIEKVHRARRESGRAGGDITQQPLRGPLF
jgi:hypothetical protein